MVSFKPVRSVFLEDDLGAFGWQELHKLAYKRRRTAAEQIVQLVRFALYRSLAGEDVELTQPQLESLFEAASQVA